MKLQKIIEGTCWTIYAVHKGNNCQVRSFIEGLPERDQLQALHVIKSRADCFHIQNKEKFRKIEDGLFELKTRNQIRFLCFWGKNRSLIITHGFKKPNKKAFRQEIKKALDHLQEYELQPIREILT